MRVSVVINTYNRAPSLRTTLDALRHQTFREFEVVVVNGPSTDGTGALLSELEGQVRAVDCPERHLAKSRNLGIDAAAGDIVAFIDDDAIPEPRWLKDLVAAYDDERIGGAGGLVLDHTGTHTQYRYSVCDRIGITDFEIEPPFDRYNVPGADPYVYLQGTNASFRRSVLAEIGGFDEEIEYNYDESEVCAQVVDAGHQLRPLPGAVVHHKFLPSHMRREAGFFTDPYFPVKNRAYFALRGGRSHRSLEEIFKSLTDYMEVLLAWAEDCEEHGRFTTLERDHFVRQLRAGFELGVERGLAGVRQSREIAPHDPGAFLPFPTLVPEGRRLGVCFVSLDYPPGPIGGISRFTNDLARGFAARGHEVHVLTQAPGQYRMDFEDGVWVHRYPYSERWVPALRGHPLAGNLEHLAAVWQALDRVLERAPIDVVSGPLWIAEPLFCAFDPRVETAMTCMTPMRVIADTQPALAERPHTRFQIELEDAALSRVQLLQPVSHANLETLRRLVPAARDVPAEVVWHGVDDRRDEFPRTRPEDPEDTEILFVGRLEPRKGVDALLEASIDLVRERPDLRIRLAGADSGHSTEGNQTYAAWLAERLAGEQQLLERFSFEGEVSDETLYRLYADCDIFCAPSRYESFGLVLAEAQMMGRPVVACRAGGMPEVVADGETGLLVEVDDVAGLRDALARLVDDRGLRARMGAAARERFEREFDNEVAVTRTLELYDRMAAARAGRPRPSGGSATESVERGVAELLGQLVGLGPGLAQQAAEHLLDPVAFPVDYEAGVRRLLPLDHEAFVRGLYELLLGREPEPAGLRGYVSALDAGLPRGELVRTVAESDEARLRGVSSAFLERFELLDRVEAERQVRAVWTLDDGAFVAGLHEALLGPDATPEAAAEARAQLAGGASRRSLLEALVADGRAGRRVAEATALLDAEYLERDQILGELRRIAPLPAREFVDGAYRVLLGRPADPDGLAAWAARLGGGFGRDELVRTFTESPEAQTRGLERGWLPEGMEIVRRGAVHPLVGRLQAAPGAERATRLGRRVVSRARAPRGGGRGGGAVPAEILGRLDELRRAVQAQPVTDTSAIEARLDELAALEDRLLRLTEAQRRATREIASRVEGVTTHVDGMGARVGEEIARTGARVGALGDRLVVMGAKHDALAMDVRERIPVQPGQDELPAPVVVDPEAYERRIEEIGALRANLGCGEKPLDGYLNVDFRPLPGVDVVADIRRLPFESGTVAEIMSAHLVEHFRQHQLETVILPYWRSLLAPDGVLRIICPNWAVMIEQLNSGALTFEDFKTVTFGLQDYSGDDHFAMYSPTTLTAVLERAGFGRFELLEERRQNGNSPELELLARPVQERRPDAVASA